MNKNETLGEALPKTSENNAFTGHAGQIDMSRADRQGQIMRRNNAASRSKKTYFPAVTGRDADAANVIKSQRIQKASI